MKEKILICLYAYYPFANANTNVMMPFINEFSKQYEVYILTQNNTGKESSCEMVGDIHVIRYNKASQISSNINTLYLIDPKKPRTLFKSIIVKIGHAMAVPLHVFFKQPEYIHILKLLKENSFAFVISTCESFSSHINVLAAKKKNFMRCPWFAYFMDPYAYYIQNIGHKKTLQLEKDVYQTSNLVFVTDEIFRENKSSELSEFISKTIPIKFGNFRTLKKPLLQDIFMTGKINCVYVGSLLNESIRNPKYLYMLCNGLDDRFCIHMICNNMTQQNIELRDKTIKNNSIFRWYKYLPLEECLGIISNADILINLGNRSTNQTPSKVFDYIGSGRPIVNFHSLNDDTSKFYLAKYPLKLNIYEDESNLLLNTNQFISFCLNNKSKSADIELVAKEYFDYMPENVAPVMIKKITEYLNGESIT